jgi:DHA3 family macrolide efflux protein-like MFS transporter
MGAVRQFVVYLSLMLVMGIGLTMAQTSVTTLVQERAEPAMQGRMFGLIGTMYSGFLLVGMSVFGPLADVVPLPLLIILSGVALAAVALLYGRSSIVKQPAKPVE